MPLYDNSAALGWEAPTLVALADWLAESTAAQGLAEAVGSAAEKKTATLAKIIKGPHSGPWDADKFTIDELANRFVEFQIFPPLEGGKAVVIEGLEVSAGGEFMLVTRRFCREAELTDRQDLYLFFLDRISAMEEQLCEWMATRNIPRLHSLTRQQGPAFGPKKTETAQGEYLFATHSIAWGDFLENE